MPNWWIWRRCAVANLSPRRPKRCPLHQLRDPRRWQLYKPSGKLASLSDFIVNEQDGAIDPEEEPDLVLWTCFETGSLCPLLALCLVHSLATRCWNPWRTPRPILSGFCALCLPRQTLCLPLPPDSEGTCPSSRMKNFPEAVM